MKFMVKSRTNATEDKISLREMEKLLKIFKIGIKKQKKIVETILHTQKQSHYKVRHGTQ